MNTSDTTRAFWRMMADRYEVRLAQATDEKDREKWRKYLAEAEAKATPKSPSQPADDTA